MNGFTLWFTGEVGLRHGREDCSPETDDRGAGRRPVVAWGNMTSAPTSAKAASTCRKRSQSCVSTPPGKLQDAAEASD